MPDGKKHLPLYMLGFSNSASLRQPKLQIRAWQREEKERSARVRDVRSMYCPRLPKPSPRKPLTIAQRQRKVLKV
jgi:hypothetical protein